MKSSFDYTGKTIFVGIDVHKKTYSVAVVGDDGLLIKRDGMSASPSRLLAYLKKYFKNAEVKSAYEAGFSGFGLHRFLNENGVENRVVHAASIEIGSRDRVKNDKRDAIKIAAQLAANRLKGIFVPSPEMEDYRELTRLRSTLVKDRNRTATRLKHKANYHSLIGPEDTQKVCKQWMTHLREKKMKACLKYVIDSLIGQWESFNEKIKELDKILKEQAAVDEKHETVYRSVKGVGPTASRTLANELGDMSQFSSERALSSYTGLTPSEYSSGEHIRRGHISRQGKPILRSVLVQCSWTAIRYDRELREVYERISRRSGAKRAIIAVARRLIGRIRACFRKREIYQLKPIEEIRQAA